MEEPESHTDGSEHALAHGNAAGLESYWPWKGRCRHNISFPILTGLETGRLRGIAGKWGSPGISSSTCPPHHCPPGAGTDQIGSGFYFCRVYANQPAGIDPAPLSEALPVARQAAGVARCQHFSLTSQSITSHQLGNLGWVTASLRVSVISITVKGSATFRREGIPGEC